MPSPGSKPLRIAVVTTAAPPSPNGQARVLGQIIVPEVFASPIFMTDQMNILESIGGFRAANWDIARAVRQLPVGTPLEWRPQ